MNAAQPIRELKDLENLKTYYESINPNIRNRVLIIFALNTALRISDILSLQWGEVYDFQFEHFKTHITLKEKKTKKRSSIKMNNNIIEVLTKFKLSVEGKKELIPELFLFSHANKNIPISRVQAFRIIKEAGDYFRIPGDISCHSLRKTFGYHAWKKGINPVVLVEIYNHSSYAITKRYLGIDQDERDDVFESIQL